MICSKKKEEIGTGVGAITGKKRRLNLNNFLKSIKIRLAIVSIVVSMWTERDLGSFVTLLKEKLEHDSVVRRRKELQLYCRRKSYDSSIPVILRTFANIEWHPGRKLVRKSISIEVVILGFVCFSHVIWKCFKIHSQMLRKPSFQTFYDYVRDIGLSYLYNLTRVAFSTKYC